MEVAVVATLHRTDMLWQQTLHAGRQRPALREKRVNGGKIDFPKARLLSLQLIERSVSPLQKMLHPLPKVVRSDRLRREFWDIVTTGKRELHFGNAPADLPDA